MEEVQRMLNRNHGEHYKVYNLCSEKTYEPSAFDGRVERFPFDGKLFQENSIHCEI